MSYLLYLQPLVLMWIGGGNSEGCISTQLRIRHWTRCLTVLGRWKSSLIARNSIWNILFPNQSIKGREGKEKSEIDERAAKKMDWFNNLSVVCNANSSDLKSEWSRNLVWCLNRFFPVSSIKKRGRKCVKRFPLSGFAHWNSERENVSSTDAKDFKEGLLAISTIILQLVYIW